MHEIEYWNGLALLKGDGWFANWIKQSGRLDHGNGLVEKLRPYIKPGDTVWDIGANIGTVTTALCELVGDEGHVHAFEPYLPAAYCCKYNCPKATVHNYAIADYAFLMLSVNQENPGASFATTDPSRKGVIPVDSHCFSDALAKLPCPQFVKIDAEGMEFEIIQSIQAARWAGFRHWPTLLIEVCGGHLERNHCTKDRLMDYLESIGYTWPADTDWSQPQFDVLLCHSSSKIQT